MALTGGCERSRQAGAGATASTPPPAATSPRTTAAPTSSALPPHLPEVTPYQLLAGEVEPACKQAAVTFAETALTTSGRRGDADLAARLARLGLAPGVAASLLPLLAGVGASALRVVYPQYGGLTADRRRASVMLVGEHLTLPAAAPSAASRPDQAGKGDGSTVRRVSVTLDIRLTSTSGGWTVTGVVPHPEPTARPGASPVVGRLLADDRVVLPRAARLDLASGTIDERVPRLLLTLAERWRLHVQVVRTGHPVDVFGADHRSNHTLGRAVDVWALDGVPVVRHDAAPWRAVMEAAAAFGADEVGGPRDLTGPGRPYFSDPVHQDHVHLGFEEPAVRPGS